ncbi:MAG: hypothetical protein HYR85_02265, partial [Planctomycetes bacterium]|nr:hypothetical protein [Planctomycetota bacterium]
MRSLLLIVLGAAAVAGLTVAIGAPGRPLLLAATIGGAVAIAAIGRLLGVACAAQRLDFFSPIVAFPCLYVVWFAIASAPLLHDLNPTRALTPIATQWPIYALGLAAWLGGVWIAARVLGGTPAGGEHRPADHFDERRLFRSCAILLA